MSAESTPITQLGATLVRSGGLAARPDIEPPDPEMLDLPEKGVQFGTGAFLRGFIGFFIDEANRRRRFGGRIVAVASTESGREQTLTRQDGLYTLAVQGVQRGVPLSTRRVITAYSRALSAQRQWHDVLALARRPELELVFSNTTEAGIVLDPEDSPTSRPVPRSFPGKLTMFLYERGRAFDYAAGRGAIVLPCELIENNGDRLREIVLALARRWRLEPAFAEWVERAVPFCNTLVDRIVPGTPDAATLERVWNELGYRDELLTVCEDYRLFSIQADAALRERLSFADADRGIVLTDDVTPFRERKVRLLNGAHTLLAPVGILCGCPTVGEAVADATLGTFVRRLLLDELAPSVGSQTTEAFALDVLDRFANPFLDHALRDITLQQTAKLRIRVIPSLAAYTRKAGRPPSSIAFGFAAWLSFMRPDLHEQRLRDPATQRPDDHADHVATLWNQDATTAHRHAGDGREGGLAHEGARASSTVRAVLADVSLWGDDLTLVPGFADAVTDALIRIERNGVRSALEHHLAPSAPSAEIEART